MKQNADIMKPIFVVRDGMLAGRDLDMRAMFPDEKGFSATNLKYMKRWYAFYSEQASIRQQPADGLQMPDEAMKPKEKEDEV